MPKQGMPLPVTDPKWRPFPDTPEDVYGVLAQYYDINWLSFRWGRAGFKDSRVLQGFKDSRVLQGFKDCRVLQGVQGQ